MFQSRIFFLVLGASMLFAAPVLKAGSGDFASDVAATAIGSGIGSTFGTIFGNAISNGSSSRHYRRPVKEVIVKEVHHVPTHRYHFSKLDRAQARLQAELDELLSQKRSLERRIRTLEQELNDTENAIEVHKESLKNIEMKRRDLTPCETAKAREVAEIEVH